MSKLLRSELKSIVKECLVEILSEGLKSSNLTLNETHKKEKHRVPETDNPKTIYIGLSFGNGITTAFYLFDFPCKIEIDESYFR